MELRIGDKLQDGSIVIRDEDRLCYQVLSASRGATGVRTISKALLAEWVDAVKNDPDAQGRELREKLCGKTEIDKFEYGYFATLKKMADMVLGNVPVIHAAPDFSDALRKAGVQFWTYSPGEQASEWGAVQKDGVIALNYHEVGDFSKLGDKDAVLAAFNAEKGDKSKHTNHAAAVIDFRDVMKPGDYVFARRGLSTYVGVGTVTGDFFYDSETSSEFRNRRKIDWFKIETHEMPDNRATRKTLTNVTKCRDFVQKLLAAFGLTGELPVEEPTAIGDRLSVSLKLFRTGRTNDWLEQGRAVNGRVREFFADYTKEKIGILDNAGVEELFCHHDGEGEKRFESMWSGKPGQGWPHIDPGDDAARLDAVKKYLARLKDDSSIGATYWTDGAEKRPKGFGPGVVTELLMKFHPEQCIKHGSASREVFEFLGLVDFPEAYQGNYSEEEYKLATGAATVILGKMKTMKLPRLIKADGSEDAAPPDYLTVNEFLWWVRENKDLIKEEVMKTEFRKVERKPKGGTKKLSDMMQDELLQRLAAALRTKPFAILAGHSGTGKSQMVRRLAYMTCADEGLMAEANEGNAPGNYCMIQVKPNWHDSTDLLGYYSEIGKKYRSTDFVRFVMKAYAYPDVPFFVCLDEMNLAPVEQYFAEYLSALESASDKSGVRLTDPLLPKDYAADEVADAESCRFTESKAWFDAHGLTLPRNLFVVGTVNMDDTTRQFSRKVLDRAMTIMMDRVKFEDMMSAEKSREPSAEDLLEQADVAKFLGGELRAKPLTTHQVSFLNAIEGVLGKTPFAVAYRFANEYALYEASLVALTGKADDEALAKEAMDHCVLMKVLPRIHGEKKELENLFRGDGTGKGLEETLDKDNTLSGKKMEEILGRKQSYLSFWP